MVGDKSPSFSLRIDVDVIWLSSLNLFDLKLDEFRHLVQNCINEQRRKKRNTYFRLTAVVARLSFDFECSCWVLLLSSMATSFWISVRSSFSRRERFLWISFFNNSFCLFAVV